MGPTLLYEYFLKHPVISLDSRTCGKGDLFFGLKGAFFDGNRYAREALNNGAAYAVVDDKSVCEDERYLLVDNVLLSLQAIANLHRKKFDIPVIAITGSNGKTTTKELMAAVLQKQYEVTATRGNLNNHIGLPLTLLGINERTQIVVTEMGANHTGEISALCRLAMPGYGIITNIGKAHLEGFGGYEGVISAKSELYHYIRDNGGSIFINSANSLLRELSQGINRISYGSGDEAIVSGNIEPGSDRLCMTWAEQGINNIYQLQTNLFGSYNFENVMAAICAGLHFGIEPQQINHAIEAYHPGNNRSQIIETKRNLVIRDAYNANPSSVLSAIREFEKFVNSPRMLILGDMFELGVESHQEHSNVLKRIASSGIENVVLIGPEFQKANKDESFTCFENTNAAAEWLSHHPPSGMAILIKGSRGMALEQLFDLL